jgi:hypothetical protein
MIPSSNSRK